jgi:molybdate transport repressor ModE-like protein
MQVHASVAFEGRHSAAGPDRIRLLEAVGREGSISGAARAVGLSYKAAWDAIDALNGLFGGPLVEARSGGLHGGGAHLTDAAAACRFERCPLWHLADIPVSIDRGSCCNLNLGEPEAED